MQTVYSPKHALRNARTELYGGELVPPFECPERMEHVLKQLHAVQLGTVLPPDDFDLAPVLRVHDPDFIEFLETCWEDWRKAGYRGEAIPTIIPARGMQQRIPRHVEGRLGYYALAMETSISDGTWEAARTSANVALTAQKLIHDGQDSAFALCRPPGHHAASDMFGGYCFINNAAICAQAFIDQGADRVTILDVDFHHGNGTQTIFYGRSDVMYCSLHGDPKDAFPHFLGYADETGQGSGHGFNHNYPMAPGTAYSSWKGALVDAMRKIADYSPDALIVSLGVDTFERDPISFFRLKSEDFKHYGGLLSGLQIPTLFVMEGGYAVEEIGINTINVLQGFEGS